MNGSTVLVVGLGDLGSRVVDALASLPGVGGRVVAAGRDHGTGEAVAAQASLVAQLLGGPSVSFTRLDLNDGDATASALEQVDPDVIVLAASRHTWWRPLGATPERAVELGRLPYGAWLPVHLWLARRLMLARRSAGIQAPVVCLPYPDAVGAVLAGSHLAPELGAGNVSEVAAKLSVAAAHAYGVPQASVRVRLVMHHASERVAFSAFRGLSGASTAEAGDEPPWFGEVEVEGRALPTEEIRAMFEAPYPLRNGRETHNLTAASAAQLVQALLGEVPVPTHAPAPAGRPGGYPVLVSRSGVTLDLPPGCGEAEAVAINEQAARADGIERIDDDGTIVWTAEVAERLGQLLGVESSRVPPDDQDAVAELMLERRDSCH